MGKPAIIPVDTCSGLSDRIAYQTAQLMTTLDAIGSPGTTGGDSFERVTAPQIYEVERDFDQSTREWELNLSGSAMFPGIPKLAAIVNSFDTHTQNVGGVSFDTFLSRSGLNVADTFGKVYFYIKGQNLSAVNVFSEKDILMGQITQLVSGTGIWAFTDGTVLGTGSGSMSETNHAAQQLLAYLGSGVTVSNSVTLTITGTKEDGSSIQRNVSFSSADPANTHKAVGAATDAVLDVTNITATGVDSATPTIFVRNLRERVPGL